MLPGRAPSPFQASGSSVGQGPPGSFVMRQLVDVYVKTRKVPDLFTNSYVFRPLATPLVLVLAKTPITPNQVTLASFLVATAAAGLLAGWLGYAGLVAGTALFTFAYVLDCVDGMLARYRGTASTVGQHFDFLMDEIKSFLLLGAAASRLFRESGEPLLLVAGLVALVSLATGIAVTTFERRPEVVASRAAEGRPAPGGRRSPLRQLLGLGMAALRLVVHYPSYLLLVGLLGRLELYFFPYAAVMVLYALRSLLWLTVRFGIR